MPPRLPFNRRLRPRWLGFTLVELLVAAFIGALMVTALAGFVVEINTTNGQETVRAETQQAMSQALDYIQADMRQAVYIYDANCVLTNDISDYCPGLTNAISFPANITPVLAFWKLETTPGLPSPIPTATTSATYQEAQDLNVSRNLYSLVVYSLDSTTPPSSPFSGPYLIRRYILRQYNWTDLAAGTLVATPGYVRPYSGAGDNNILFRSWPCTENTTCPTSNYPVVTALSDHEVLTDLVDNQSLGVDYCTTLDPTGTTYNRVIATVGSQAIDSFYACVRIGDETASAGSVQDAYLSLRGNALYKLYGATTAAGFETTKSTQDLDTYLPTLTTQVQARSVFERVPPAVNYNSP